MTGFNWWLALAAFVAFLFDPGKAMRALFVSLFTWGGDIPEM